jgi:hypothetical protein
MTSTWNKLSHMLLFLSLFAGTRLLGLPAGLPALARSLALCTRDLLGETLAEAVERRSPLSLICTEFAVWEVDLFGRENRLAEECGGT